MATVVNDRDVLMQLVSPRFTAPSGAIGVLLNASTNVFQVTGGTGAPTSITLNAVLLGLTGTVTFSTSPAVTLTTTGNSTALTFANMGANNSVVVTASITSGGVTYTALQTISKLVTLGALATQSSVNLATQITGALATGNISGLGALATLNSVSLSTQVTGALPSGSVSGLGSLATQSSVNANTQVTNLGSLAYANSIAANQIGAGTLAAGVIYAGSISANNVTAGTLIGSIIQTATSGQRVTINESSNGAIKFYDVSGASTCSIGVGGALVTYAGTSNPGIGAYSNAGGAAAISASASAGGNAINASTSGGGNAIYADGAIFMPIRSAGVANTTLNSVIASQDNAYQCGYTGARWANIYAVNNVIQTSDVRTKTDVTDSDLGLEFINSLRPVSYRMIVGQNDVSSEWVVPLAEPVVTVTPRAGARRHYGLIAQEVKAALGDANIAIWSLDDKDDPDSPQALTYTELIAPLIKAVQELHIRVQAQQDEINLLKGA